MSKNVCIKTLIDKLIKLKDFNKKNIEPKVQKPQLFNKHKIDDVETRKKYFFFYLLSVSISSQFLFIIKYMKQFVC